MGDDVVEGINDLGDNYVLDTAGGWIESIGDTFSGLLGNGTEPEGDTPRRSFWGSLIRQPIKNKAEAYRNVLSTFTNP